MTVPASNSHPVDPTAARSFYIDGTWVAPARPAYLPVVDPASERVVAEVASGCAEDVERAVAAARAAFATKHLWATRYEHGQIWPAGRYPNAHQGGGGLPAYTAGDRSIDGEDMVLWHTFGLTHFPRTEDWPVMPVDTCGFTLKPVGFLDRNPTLDVPRSTGADCHG